MSIEKLTAVADELAAAKAKLAEFAKSEGRSAVGAAFAQCFEAPTTLKSIRWRQYTPHFNDGEACVFSVHGVDMVTEVDGKEVEHDDVEWSLKPGKGRESEWGQKLVAQIGAKSADAFSTVWSQMSEELLLAVFGDHTEITITASDVTVEEYEHD